jgi:GDP-L-fucose synthase
VETLHSFLGFDYEFDTSKSSGFPKRVMDISRARELIHYSPTTSLLDGLKQTWDWYINNQDEHLRKMNYFKEQ